MKFLKLFLKSRGIEPPLVNPADNKTDDYSILKLQSEIAGLKLTVEQLKQELENGQSLLAESEKSRQSIISDTVDAKLQNLLGNLASPLSQIALLQSLISAGKEIKTENIFKLVSIIESNLGETGLVRLHQVGENLPFDSECMGPLKPGVIFSPGEKIIVRLPGYLFKGKYICLSLVDKTD